MIDKIELTQNEETYIDTTSNTATILVYSGSVEVYNSANTLVATLNAEEIYTLPIQTGVYKIKCTSSGGAKCYVFRMFIY